MRLSACCNPFLSLATTLLSVWLLALFAIPVNADWTERVSEVIQEMLQAPSTSGDVDNRLFLVSPDEVINLYQNSGFTPLWSRAGKVLPQAGEIIEIIRSRREGLNPRNYGLERVEKVIHRVDESNVRTFARVELLLTDVLVSYANDLLKGTLWGHSLRKGDDSDPEQTNLASLASAVSSNQLAGALSALVPQFSAYTRLRDALQLYRALQKEERAFHLPRQTLKRGAIGADVKTLRQRLVFLRDLSSQYGEEDVYDDVLERAVVRFQQRHGLETDGIAGVNTFDAMFVSMSDRVSQIEHNLERWRWLPRDLGRRYVVANIAGFNLEVVEDDNFALEMRIIVGKPFQQTPVFSSKITHLTLNPFWEVPYSIAIKEILPKVRQDPYYLQREHMRVLHVDEGRFREIDPATVNWAAVSKTNFPYRFRQDPGPANALGRIKFFLPNRYSVYLHDTPNKSLFSQSVRCFSHGCVRIEKPFQLAAYLLRDKPEWTWERIIETLDHEKNYRVMLTVPIPIYIVYWTAWVDRQGIVNFRNDVYGRDRRLDNALAQ